MATPETSASSMEEKKNGQDDELEGARITEFSDKRSRKLTEKGLNYQRSVKDTNYQQCKRKLNENLDVLDMNWTDLSDVETLREERAILEKGRKKS